MDQLFFSFMTALVVCMALIPPLRLAAVRFQIMDVPGERKVHQHPIPRVGGIAVAIGACGTIAWWMPKDASALAILFGCAVIVAFGVWDDRADLSYRVKLLGQVAAALVVVVLGDIRLNTVPFTHDLELPLWISIPVTVLFLVGVSNAVNLTDGLDGLAGGLSFITLSGIAYLAYLAQDLTVLSLTIPFLGALLGFLRFNTYPARIFMGDGGSQLLGYIMGVSAILLTDVSRGPFTPSLMLFILGLPFLDTLGVIGQRLAEGRSPFIGDRKHIHHKLLRVGLTHYEAVTVIYVIQVSMLGVAYMLRWHSDMLIIPLYLVIAGSVLMLFVAVGRGLISTPVLDNGHFLSDVTLTRFLHGPWLTDIPIRFLAVAIPCFLIAMVFFPRQVPDDVGYLSIVLFGIVLLGISVSSWIVPYVVRGGLYIGTTFLLYVSEDSILHSTSVFLMTHNVFFILIATMVLLSLRFNEVSCFQMTPLDYLMVFLAVTFPLLPEVSGNISHVGIIAAKLMVLFFSFELLLQVFSDRVRQLGLVSLWVLFGLGVRVWL